LSELNEAYAGTAIVLWKDGDMSREPLRPLDQGERVWEMQYELAKIGGLQGEPNGVYDEATREGILRIQRACGIRVDGVYGVQTRMAVSGWLDEGAGPHLGPDAFPAGVLELMTGKESGANAVPVMDGDAGTVVEALDGEDVPEEIEVPAAVAEDETYEPLLEFDSTPSSESVTEPARVIVPLVPSKGADGEGVE
jgi:peptidoglycan hydrolase-like protein with peptidoglycan-binding domain